MWKIDKKMLGVLMIVLPQIILTFLLNRSLNSLPTYVEVMSYVVLNWILFSLLYVFLKNKAVVVSHRYRRLNSKYELTMILYNLLNDLAQPQDKKTVYDRILKAAILAIPRGTLGSVIVLKDNKLFFEASCGFDSNYLELIELKLEDLALYKMTEGRMDRAIIIPNILHVNDSHYDRSMIEIFKKAGVEKVRSSISAPIRINNTVVGCINLDSTIKDGFISHDTEVLEVFALEVSKFIYMSEIIEENKRMSQFDELTKIYNRSYCNKIIKQYILEEVPFVLVSADLNNLKVINDLYGHDMGDSLIMHFVNSMKLFIPDNVLFSRYGGDEFIFVFPSYELVEALVVMEDASIFFSNHPITEKGSIISVSFSFGSSECPKETKNYDELLKIADQRMYRKKRKYKESL